MTLCLGGGIFLFRLFYMTGHPYIPLHFMEIIFPLVYTASLFIAGSMCSLSQKLLLFLFLVMMSRRHPRRGKALQLHNSQVGVYIHKNWLNSILMIEFSVTGTVPTIQQLLRIKLPSWVGPKVIAFGIYLYPPR